MALKRETISPGLLSETSEVCSFSPFRIKGFLIWLVDDEPLEQAFLVPTEKAGFVVLANPNVLH